MAVRCERVVAIVHESRSRFTRIPQTWRKMNKRRVWSVCADGGTDRTMVGPCPFHNGNADERSCTETERLAGTTYGTCISTNESFLAEVNKPR